MQRLLKEYSAVIDDFRKRAAEALLLCENTVECGLVLVRCQELKEALAAKAESVAALLLEQVGYHSG